MDKQKIEHIKVEELHLWTENPRDPIDEKVSDYEIIKRAMEKKPDIWELDKLLEQMGDHYDFSELPTVVYHGKIPVVYDGNRRIAVIKYAQNEDLYKSISGRFYFGDIPESLVALKEIPCNVCEKEIALENIERKHAQSGSWGQLEREYFINKHKGKSKSKFLIIDETSNLISEFPILNRRFVMDETFTEKNLNEIGFGFDEGKFKSSYKSDEEADFSKHQGNFIVFEKGLSELVQDMLRMVIQIENENKYYLSITKIKENFRVPKITQQKIKTKNKLINNGKKILELEKEIVKNLIKIPDSLFIQEFNEYKIENNVLIISKGNDRSQFKIVGEEEVLQRTIDEFLSKNGEKHTYLTKSLLGHRVSNTKIIQQLLDKNEKLVNELYNI